MDKNQIKRFNIRVYGILYSEDGQFVLLSEEHRFGKSFTKFPGGGLEFGEGINDALKREFQEELAIDILVADFFYTNDFLQLSAFNEEEQLISIYYKVKSYTGIISQPQKNTMKNYFKGIEASQVFRWVSLKNLNQNLLTFPIDKIVADQLRT